MSQTGLFGIGQPALALLPQLTTVLESLKTAGRHWQTGQRTANLHLNVSNLLAGQPLAFGAGAGNLLQLLLENTGGNTAHFRAPLLPQGIQMMIKTLRFIPLGAV